MKAGTAASTIFTDPQTYTSWPARSRQSASMASCTRPVRPGQSSCGCGSDSTGTTVNWG